MARFSASKDTETHGQKLYSLFAKQREAYLKLTAPVAIGQIIIKESWVAEDATGKIERVGNRNVVLTPDADIVRGMFDPRPGRPP